MRAPNQSTDMVREAVRRRYAQAARAVLEHSAASCCGPSSASSCCGSEPISLADIAGYRPEQVQELPTEAVLASLGCGNPVALAALEPGQDVLDLGSGGGIDVLLSARRVAPSGTAYGIDMTDEMLALAERNRREAGIENARFLKGHIEDLPLPDASVDVVISNCVINLSADKAAVLCEAFRVLRPGGRFAVSDIVTRGPLPEALRADLAAWSSCISGALDEHEYVRLLEAAGFVDISVEPTRSLTGADLGECCGGLGEVEVLSAFVRARKPDVGEDRR